MYSIKRLALPLMTAAAALGAPALAQTPPPASAPAAAASTTAATPAKVDVKAGATVTDTSGGEVGTIESVSGDLAVLSTGANKVSLPLASFAAGEKGLMISMTRDQVDAAAAGATAAAAADANADAKAKLAEQLKAGATVSDTSGATVGKIEAVEGGFATVATASTKVRLPVTAFGAGDQGLVIAMTADDLDAAAKAATGGAGAAPGDGSR